MVDAALGLKKLGHSVDIYTSYHDPGHCFEETRDGVYFPFSVASGSKESSDRAQLTYDKIEANVPIAESGFKFPTKAK